MALTGAFLSSGAFLLRRALAARLGTEFAPLNLIVSEALSLAALALATAIMGRFEHRGPADYGLPLSRFPGRQFWSGALWGFVMLSLIMGAMAATRTY